MSAPIDRVKLLYMVNENRTLTYEKAMKTWKTITENTGMRGLWKGKSNSITPRLTEYIYVYMYHRR